MSFPDYKFAFHKRVTLYRYDEDFTRAMGELECIQDGMSTLGREAAAQNDELQAAGRPLLGCFEEFRDCRVTQQRVSRATDAVAKCQVGLYDILRETV